MSTNENSVPQTNENIKFDEIKNIAKRVHDLLMRTFPQDEELHNEKSQCSHEEKKTDQLEDPPTDVQMEEHFNDWGDLVGNAVSEIKKLTEELKLKNRVDYPLFTKLYNSWEATTKPEPYWMQVEALEVYLYSSQDHDKSNVSEYFFSQVWKDFKNEAYVPKVCKMVQKIFPDHFVGVHHDFALHVVNNLKDNLKPNLDNVA